MTLPLLGVMPFGRGGNRLCYVHPEKKDVCVKVRRPDFTLIDLRKSKGFPKNLKPISSFDDNAEEYRVLNSMNKIRGNDAFAHICMCYGYERTDMGLGLCVELVRNADGRISQTLKQTLWEDGYTEDLRVAVEALQNHWVNNAIPSRDLLLHNIVVQRDESGVKRLVVIDGLGSSGVIPSFLLPKAYWQRKAFRKVENMNFRIEELLERRKVLDKFPGKHGLLIHEGV